MIAKVCLKLATVVTSLPLAIIRSCLIDTLDKSWCKVLYRYPFFVNNKSKTKRQGLSLNLDVQPTAGHESSSPNTFVASFMAQRSDPFLHRIGHVPTNIFVLSLLIQDQPTSYLLHLSQQLGKVDLACPTLTK